MDINDIILSRRTIRKFSQKPLNTEQLIKYVNAARVAPSAANLQPLKYVIINTPDMADKMFPLVKWAGYLGGKYTPNDNERPVAYIAVLADTDIRKDGYDIDIGAAVENLILSALADGVGACWMAAIDYNKITELLDLPENLKLCCVVAMGYPAEAPKEVCLTDGGIKYFLDGDTLCVPKRSIEEVIVKSV